MKQKVQNQLEYAKLDHKILFWKSTMQWHKSYITLQRKGWEYFKSLSEKQD